jgi:murein DD-endopeptidase MepM/ murein hydrolase activator NlpD
MMRFGLALCLAAATLRGGAWKARVEPADAPPGSVVVCSLDGPAPPGLVLAGFQQEAGFYVSGGRAIALLAVPLGSRPGRHRLSLKLGRRRQRLSVDITRDPYPLHRVRRVKGLSRKLAQGLSSGEAEMMESAEAESAGPPLWREALRWPLEGPITVTSPFGSRRIYNRGEAAWTHKGLDLRAPYGTPVYSAGQGVVLLARKRLAVTGGTVLVGHGYGVTTAYYHLSRVDVKPGQRVEPGQRLGLSGQSGIAAGPHLHWQVALRGRPVDPRQWLDDPARARATAP